MTGRPVLIASKSSFVLSRQLSLRSLRTCLRLKQNMGNPRGVVPGAEFHVKLLDCAAGGSRNTADSTFVD